MKPAKSALFLTLTLAFSCYAQQDDVSTEKIYNDFRFSQSAWRFETLLSPAEWKTKCGTGSHDFYCETENSKRMFQLREVLKKRANAGDSHALFYMGILSAESGAPSNREGKTKYGTAEYENAIGYYKKACAAGLPNACWNVANIYVDGLGETKSGLAAAEWFYTAGLGYLANGQRERALAALEEIQKIDSKHPLAKKLNLQLQKGAPK